ncbi:MAG: glycine cleavage system protein T [Desulfuromonas sp.]|nr:MAG: glycine cleavage system protein T [Desulfuromonas sp.]
MLNKTPLNALHRELGARMVPFGGWDMPVQYSGVIDEHLAVRRDAGLFDVSHMGEVFVEGPDALSLAQHLTTNDATKLADGQVQYSALCRPDGGTVDDVTLYRFGAERFMFCVNAANSEKDFAWMEQVLEASPLKNVTLRNASHDYAQIALQGLKAEQILARLTDCELESLGYYRFREGTVADIPTIISRTGYTGAGGFELYTPADQGEAMWRALSEAGKDDGLVPVGLGARDTLRLEMGYALYGHELSDTITPLEASLGWITKLDADNFVGREALLRQKEEGVPRRLVGFTMDAPGIPRAEYPVYVDDREVGVVTSGTQSPSLRQGVGLALLESRVAEIGRSIEIGIRARKVAATICKPPFLKK